MYLIVVYVFIVEFHLIVDVDLLSNSERVAQEVERIVQ